MGVWEEELNSFFGIFTTFYMNILHSLSLFDHTMASTRLSYCLHSVVYAI